MHFLQTQACEYFTHIFIIPSLLFLIVHLLPPSAAAGYPGIWGPGGGPGEPGPWQPSSAGQVVPSGRGDPGLPWFSYSPEKWDISLSSVYLPLMDRGSKFKTITCFSFFWNSHTREWIRASICSRIRYGRTVSPPSFLLPNCAVK